MPEKRIPILNHQQIQQKLDRIAYQILEDNFNERELIIAGILPRGNFLAARLKKILDTIAPFKTTLINLLLGFLEPDAGSILFNSQPVSQSERQQYWPFIAYIKQQHFVLHDTLLVNIILNDEPYDKLKFQEAITLSGLSGFIKEHPEGFSYPIQEQGRNISGGQRQRMALARALYKDAPLLIADEPFTELDRESTVQLIKTCKQLADKGKMILLITHDSYALSQCNRVISLDE